MSCAGYLVEIPWGHVYVVECDNVVVSDEALSRAASQSTAVMRTSMVDPCQAALAYMYANEDYDTGTARLRNRSLWALTYLLRASRASEAIEKARSSKSLVVVSNSAEGALRATSETLGFPVSVNWAIPSCSPEGLAELASYRISVLVK